MSFKVIFERRIYVALLHILHAQASLTVIGACYALLCPKSAETKMFTKPYEMLKYQLEQAENSIKDYILE